MKEPYSTTDCVFTFQSIMDQHSLEDHYLRTTYKYFALLSPSVQLKKQKIITAHEYEA